MREWVVAAVVGLVLATGCARRGDEPPVSEPYLLVWAGDADRKNADFIAVIDAEPRSKTYGAVLKTYPVRSRGNEPQGLAGGARDDRMVLATGTLSGRLFAFDFRQPLAARLLGVEENGPSRRLWAPHAVAMLPNGHAVVACSDPARFHGTPRELLGAPGGLIEVDANGKLLREISAAEPSGRPFVVAPYGAAVSSSLGRLVTTSNAHGYTPTAVGERTPGITVQVWRLDDLTPLKTVVLPAGPRGEENLAPIAPRFARTKPFLFVDTELGGALYVSDSVHMAESAFRLVFDFGAGSLPGEAALTPDDRFYVAALTGKNRLVSLDVNDPWSPKPVSAVRFDGGGGGKSRGGGPRAIALSSDGRRVAVSDYSIDVPGYFRDGDHRVYLVRLDPASGELRIDDAFRDELTGEVGVDFDRASWPHGASGPARPAGMVFVAPAPPSR
jgi:hypothetical protein